MARLFQAFIVVLSFNIFLQLDIAEDIFDSLFTQTQTAAKTSPICGTEHAFVSKTSKSVFFGVFTGAFAASSLTAKYKIGFFKVDLYTVSVLTNHFVDLYKNTFSSFTKKDYYGLSPPLA